MRSSAAKLAEAERGLIEDIASCYYEPYRFVMYAYPWGEAGPLKDEPGPDKWQTEALHKIGLAVRAQETGQVAKSLRGLDLAGAIRMAVASGHGIGKLHCNSVELDTPDGLRRWEDIEVGDRLFGRLGFPTRVTGKFPRRNCAIYRVTFDDGSSTLVGYEHLWAVRGRQERRKGLADWRVMATADLLEAGVKRPNGAAMARQWEIPGYEAVEFPERAVGLHPYVMGIWLGDGVRWQPSYAKPYSEIRQKIESLGYKVHVASDQKIHRIQGVTHLITDHVFGCCSPDRYIPADYKYNSAANRWELFCGLMDTDGETHNSGSIGYSSTSKRLAEDVIWLARSFGFKAMMQPTIKQGWYFDEEGERVECRECWRVTINADRNPFSLEHRRVAYKPSEHRYQTRWIDSIEFSHYEDGHCVTVDSPDHLYLANDFIVTHNTALIAWIIQWFISTREFPQIVVTASTQTQLSTKTWREVAKWHRLMLNQHWFKWTATKFYHVKYPETWFASAIPWSEHNADAFAGTHEKYVLVIYDEANAVADIIWDTTEGALTTKGAIWLAFGNYTRNTGRFDACFTGVARDRWLKMQVDSRDSRKANRAQIDQWIADYGEDSDFVRIRVRGIAPRSGSNQFISQELAEQRYRAEGYESAPKVLALDVARYGDNQSVAVLRQGRKVTIAGKWRGLAIDQLSDRFCALIDELGPDAVVVDGDGIGGAVVDYVRRRNYHLKAGKDVLVEFHGGGTANDVKMYFNRRAEIWGRMRDGLKDGLELPGDNELKVDLVGPEYYYATKGGFEVIQLESKDDMRSRGIASPDSGDALALTYAVRLQAPRRWEVAEHRPMMEVGGGSSGQPSMAWLGR